MKVTIFYVGSSLLGPLRQAERDINARYGLGLAIACHNCTLPLDDAAWTQAERDLADAYRQTRDEKQREQLFVTIGAKARNLNLSEAASTGRN